MRTHSRYAAAALACAAAATIPALIVTTGGNAQAPTARTLTLQNASMKISQVDLPPLIRSKRSPETPGDEVIATSKVSGGGATGTRYLMCAAARRGPSVESALYSCQVTYNLADGTITAAGVARIGGSAPVTVAITGGTGAYAGASGTVTSANGADTLTIG
jgi:hypothetical protein